MKRILYILQQSIYDKKWTTADSNINMMVGMLRQVTKLTDWKFDIMIAPLEDFSDIESYDEIFKHDNVDWIPYKFPIDAFINRQNFDALKMTEILVNGNYDVVWNNLTETSRNIKTILHYKNLGAKLITTCYWLDTPVIGKGKVPSTISYDWRQFDGFECSDLVVFTCESTQNQWVQNSSAKFSASYISKILAKSVVWDFGFSAEEFDTFNGEKLNLPRDKKIVLFLNRLSGINYTHHEEFIKAVNSLYEKRDDFAVVFTNPSQKISWDQLEQDVKPLHIVQRSPLTRNQYVALLRNANVSVHLFESEAYGGCANVESLYCNNLSVMPKINEYAKRATDTYVGFFELPITPEKIENTLDKTLNSLDNMLMKTLSSTIVYKMSSFESISKDVVNDINNLFEEKNG